MLKATEAHESKLEAVASRRGALSRGQARFVKRVRDSVGACSREICSKPIRCKSPTVTEGGTMEIWLVHARKGTWRLCVELC